MKEDFTDRLNETMLELNLTPEQVADACKVSYDTVDRWLRGVTAPHELAQPSVFRVLEKLRR